ncbi:hypothetical protein [Caviibacterium pharyngocola]|uniref:Uncharacterized protein n=1 Tax=Caviibacterium pharyngocola TaxID=28159 RepID=A0A2M8RUM5_9PAST|nr:hypothetical protein [Caviibacterium pharyngocola]PJG82593.1 hypothetical protein CVP04_08615 [Caviibacterium pharyngocola]
MKKEKKALTIILLTLPFFVFGKNFSKEYIDNTHRYIIYESIYFHMKPAEIIGLHCLSSKGIKGISNTLLNIYPELKDEVFAIEELNKNICKIAIKGLLSFEEIERYKSEIEQDKILNQKNKQNR